jgi:hypothetical protein
MFFSTKKLVYIYDCNIKDIDTQLEHIQYAYLENSSDVALLGVIKRELLHLRFSDSILIITLHSSYFPLMWSIYYLFNKFNENDIFFLIICTKS